MSHARKTVATATTLCLGVFAVPARAANHTVKSGGGGDYTTIQACATAMSAGDTCTVYAGTYNENVTVSAGSAGQYKTLTVNPGDTVYVHSFTIGSYDKVNGFHIQNPSSPSSADCVTISGGSSYFYITNNVISQCGSHAGIYERASSPVTSHGFIEGNTISYPCSPLPPSTPNVCGAIQLQASHHLIENNDISHVSDGFQDFSGDHNILRGNRMHDVNVADCGSHSSNCHIDFLETEPNPGGGGIPSQYNVIEGNTQLNAVGANTHGWLAQGDVCGGECHNLIIRFNQGAHVGGAGILDDNAHSSTNPGYYDVKSYNNTWVDYVDETGNQAYGVVNGFLYHSTNGAEINDLFYFPEALTDFNAYATDSTTSATFTARNNLAYCTASPCNIHGTNYGSGNFTDDPGNIIGKDPQFVSYAGNNFNLQTGSPAMSAGSHLTTVASSDSGSGTSLVVDDAAYFQDGYGIAGVSADCIAVTTTTNHVCIKSIDYQTNTLTLASSITRSAGDPVWLYSDSTGARVLNASAPDIGATFAGGGSAGAAGSAGTAGTAGNAGTPGTGGTSSTGGSAGAGGAGVGGSAGSNGQAGNGGSHSSAGASSNSGCSCRAAGQDSDSSAALALLLAGAALVSVRRRWC